jgi:hypothetical protein
MAKGRDRPRKEPKRKAKDKTTKAGAPKVPPVTSYEPPASVEVIKPKRKEREPRDEE